MKEEAWWYIVHSLLVEYANLNFRKNLIEISARMSQMLNIALNKRSLLRSMLMLKSWRNYEFRIR